MLSVNYIKGKLPVGVDAICRCFGFCRDAYYKLKRRKLQQQDITSRIIQWVQIQRKQQPMVGARKLYKKLKTDCQAEGLRIGRDRFFKILRENGLLVKPRRLYCKTTNSAHGFRKYLNLIKELKVTRPNQVWVSDITYIRTTKGFCYLALISDLYSRKILGYDVSNSLELTGALNALKMAIKTAHPAPGLIHHSDRGIQYCSHDYTAMLHKHYIKISMTQENHCYENAVAERINGILKNEFFLNQVFNDFKDAQKAVENAIQIYNSQRLHLSLDYKTPNQVFLCVA